MTNLKRLHLASIFVSFFAALKNLIIPLLFGLVLGGSREPIGFFRFEYIWIAVIIFILFTGIAQWITFKYCVHEGELYVQRGIFVKKKRYIHQSRVQSIDITAGIVQRTFGLVKLKIETAGGGAEPEVELTAISRQEAEEIRAILLEKNEIEPLISELDAYEEEREVWQLGKRPLMISALTSSGIGLVISAVIALFSQVEQFLPETLYDTIFGFLSKSGIIALLAIILFILVVAWAISIISTVLKYGGFKIEKAADELVISRGLLEQRQLTIQTNRVTAVRIVSNLFRQPFGYATVFVESAGGGSADEQLSTVLLPLVKKDDIHSIFSAILPEYAFSYDVNHIPRRALPRFFIRLGILPFFITIGVGAFATPYGFYGFIIVFLACILGYLQFLDAGSGKNSTHLWVRFRKISQVTVLTSKKKIQSAEYTVSPFQKRKRLASFRFSVLSSMSGKTFTVLDLEQTRTEELLNWYGNSTEVT